MIKCEHCEDTGFRKVQDEDGNEVKKLCECSEPGGLNGDDVDEDVEHGNAGVLVRA